MTLSLNRSELPDDLDERPALKAFFEAIDAQSRTGGTDLNALVTATARAIDIIETRLLELEDGASEDDGDWTVEELPGEFTKEQPLPPID